MKATYSGSMKAAYSGSIYNFRLPLLLNIDELGTVLVEIEKTEYIHVSSPEGRM
jgi:hypothetical protein